jgi:asparagine synthase (glutamine-hydrolysing)
MCGIAGVVVRGGRQPDVRRAALALDKLEHRGPDDWGCLWSSYERVESGRRLPDERCAAETLFLHRRLAILDLSPAGWQPMSTANGRYHIVFNGEIYNYRELQQVLGKLGRTFRSQCDTEVLLEAYAEWGTAALQKLEGMFAFAILDTVERVVFLARDAFGIKPLYYSKSPDATAFASEIPALLELIQCDRKIDAERLYLYARYGVTDHGSSTMLADIRQLPAGHFMRIPLDDGTPTTPVRYWELTTDRAKDLAFPDAVKHVRELFLESVSLHLRSDVPVGTALSGGIDSSSISAAMRYIGGPEIELHAFSYIAEDPSISEERWIQIAVNSTGATLHRVTASALELAHDMDDLIRVQGEPFGSTSIYAQYRVLQRAKAAGIKVLLDGQGADEILAGYRYNLAARVVSLVRQGDWSGVAKLLSGAQRLSGSSILDVVLRAGEHLAPPNLRHHLRRAIGRDVFPKWLNAQWFIERGVEKRAPGELRSRNALREQLYSTLSETSLPHLLRFEDRNSMASSVEARVPFLNRQLVEFLFALPEEHLISADGTSKAVFRAAMRGIVPDAILDRRDKIGFATPELQWLSSLRPWIEQTLGSATPADLPACDVPELHRQWRLILDGRQRFDSRVWRWINLVAWSRQFSVRFE